LKQAAAVLGNSSSGIIEAPALGVPAIDVGDRQRGRASLSAVRRVPAAADAIADALARALNRGDATPGQRDAPEGPAAPRVIAALRAWHPPRPPRKPFVMLDQPCDP
ncbi:MAG: UDP-N-acetylglucosamine 2-epimerase, partial [Gemmatimonadaceae bacterium]